MLKIILLLNHACHWWKKYVEKYITYVVDVYKGVSKCIWIIDEIYHRKETNLIKGSH